MNTRSKSKSKLSATNLPLFYQILNDRISFYHLFQFLTLFDVGKIDTVFKCSNEITNQTKYLLFLKEIFPRHIFPNTDKYWIGESFAKWLMKCQIYLQHIRITLSGYNNESDLFWISKFCEFYQKANLLENPNTVILSLRFSFKGDGSVLNGFIQCCRYLKDINLSSCINLKPATMLRL